MTREQTELEIQLLSDSGSGSDLEDLAESRRLMGHLHKRRADFYTTKLSGHGTNMVHMYKQFTNND